MKLRAFRDNTDNKLLKRWKKVLSSLPSKLKIDSQYRRRAIKYGIHEIYQQAADLDAGGAGKIVKEYRKLLTKTYGNDDVVVRKGREVIVTIDGLKNAPSTCLPGGTIKKCR